LNQYGDFDAFNRHFKVSPGVFSEFLDYASSHGIKKDREGAAYARERISTLFKAYIARNLYDNEGFYPIFLSIDEDYQKAISLIHEQET
jgi:carboxyl-terminal processing protease